MNWQPLEVVTPPTGEVSLAAARQYCRFAADQTNDDDGVLDAIRAAVPYQLERQLNRALFAQRRAVVGVMAPGEVLSGATLEPHTALAVTVEGTPARVVSYGASVYFPDSIYANGVYQAVRMEYDAGWQVLPPDLLEGVLYEIMVRYVRRNEAANQSETVRLPRSRPVLSHYMVHPDPTRTALPVVNLAAD